MLGKKAKGLDDRVKLKPSGADWIGDIPAHWRVKKLKYLCKVVTGSTPSSSVEDYWGGEILWVTPEDLGKLQEPYIYSTKRAITQKGYDACGATVSPKDSIVLSSRAPIGSLGIAGNELCSNQGCKIIVSQGKVHPKYIYYILLSNVESLNSLGQGTTFKELSLDSLENINILYPPIDEQRQIAAFLDKETSSIDLLEQKIKRSIDLLKEYRSSLITNAVLGRIDINNDRY